MVNTIRRPRELTEYSFSSNVVTWIIVVSTDSDRDFHVANCTTWQLSRPGEKLGRFERHLLTRVSYDFAFFTTDGRSGVKKSQSCRQPITDRLGLIVMNLMIKVNLAHDETMIHDNVFSCVLSCKI
jgi:hypothetical protein